MSNLYYTPTTAIQPYTTAKASDLVAEFARIEAAFDRLPEPDVLTNENLALALLELDGATRVNTSTGQTVEERLSALPGSVSPTFTGTFTIAGARPISFNPAVGEIKVLGNAAGWDVGASYGGPNGSTLGRFGALGNNNALTYLYMGPAYDNANSLRVYPTYAAWGTNPLWHAGNFNPAGYAALSGATFTGGVQASYLEAAGAGIGGAVVAPGGAAQAGYVSFRNAAGTQLAYIGNQAFASPLLFYSPTGFEFLGNPVNLNSSGQEKLSLKGSASPFIRGYSAGGTQNGFLQFGDGGAMYVGAYGAGGSVRLQIDGVNRLTADATGVSITGGLSVNGTAVALNDLSNLNGGLNGIALNYQGSGSSALLHEKSLILSTYAAAASGDVQNVHFLRQAAYAGGTPGFVNSAVRATTVVSNAAAAAFEWTTCFVMDNNAAAGENVAMYAQAIKRNTGPTFGQTVELIEASAVNNPTTGSVGQELDISVNGTDSNYMRIGTDLVVRRYDTGGADAVAGYGFRIQNGGYANSVVRIGFGLAAGMKAEIGFDTSIGSTLVAMRIAEGQAIQLDATGDHSMSFSSVSGGLRYGVFGLESHVLEDSGVHYMHPIAAGSLPAAGKAGRKAFVTGLSSTARDAVVASGGSGARFCYDDGTSWRVI